MEDLFDILLMVAAIVIGFAAKNKSSKKKKTSDRPAPAPKAEPASSVNNRNSRLNIENAVKAFSELLEVEEELPDPEKPASQSIQGQTSIEAELSKPAQPKAKRKKKKLSSGESVTDAHGCIGGSMPVHAAEGESVAEHAKHELDRQQHLQQNAPVIGVESLRRPSTQELRRAIVMSEVLDKPVSLRGRRL